MKALACVNREAEKVARIVVNGEPGRGFGSDRTASIGICAERRF